MGGLFLRESPHQLPASEYPIPCKYPSTRARLVPPFRQGRLWGREMRIATGAVRPRNDIVFCKECDTKPGGSSGRPTPTDA